MRNVLPCLLGAAKVAAKPPGPMDFIVAKAVSLRVLHACMRDNLITRVRRQQIVTYVLLTKITAQLLAVPLSVQDQVEGTRSITN